MLPDFGTDLIAAANAWSVESLDGNDIASQAFAFSLFPYLALLYFLGDKNRMDTPDKANFGFRFLLAFVFMTIPAGIAAKVYYNDILANVDWLHGGAESLLTVTNLFIASGFRQAIQETSPRDAAEEGAVNPQIFVFAAIATAAFTFGAAPALAGLGLAPPHPEPANALSFPTWLIHVSSLVEWLASMALVWQWGEHTGNPRWKGLTWGMIPLHTSGIVACTFHFFYNRPAYFLLVALQGLLTCIGNTTMAFAAWRIWAAAAPAGAGAGAGGEEEGAAAAATAAAEVPKPVKLKSDNDFWVELLAYTFIGSILIKWGELYLNFPFEDNILPALAMIFIPTCLNIAKWTVRSQGGEDTGML